MTATWVYFRAELHRRWRGWLGLALILGMFGGAVEGAAAGARRTDAAYPILVAWSKAPDVLIYSFPGQSSFANLAPASLERLRHVTAGAQLSTFVAMDPAVITLIAPAGNRVPGSFWRRKILAGRVPDPARPGEVDTSFTLAQAEHLAVGRTLRVVLMTGAGAPVPFRFRIVGIDAAAGEFPPQYGTGTDFVWATPAFYRLHRRGLDSAATTALWLRHGAADIAAVEGEATRLAHGKAVNDYPLGPQADNTEHSLHLQAVALWLLAVVLAVVGLLALGQLLARLTYLESADYPTLRALGMSRRHLLAAGLGRAAVIGVAGSVTALMTAVVLSPLFPVGLAGIAEPDRGIDADWLVLGPGLIASVGTSVACAVFPAWRAATRMTAPGASPGYSRAPGRLLILVASALGSVTGVTGIRLALQRGAGRTALPVRSTIAGAVIGVVALSAALVFSGSLGHLLATPALYGQTWELAVGNLQDGPVAAAGPSVNSDHQVAAWSEAYVGAPIEIRGIQVGSFAMGPGRGASSLMPVLTAGRLPDGAGDIVLGERTLAAIHSRIGATVSVSIEGMSRLTPLRIVGTAVFPTVGDTIGLGAGAALTVAGLHSLAPPGLPFPPFDGILVRFRPDVAAASGSWALASRLERLGPFGVEGPGTPADLLNFGDVQGLPLLLGLGLGVLALATLAHLLVTSVRRRRRDLAVLRTLGFTRRQVRATVAWQAGTLVAVALVIGVPAGIVCGRLVWQLFAHQLGIPPVIEIPVASFALLVTASMALALVIAAPPAEAAARVRPARVLRSE